MSEPGQYAIEVVFNDANARKQASGLQTFLNTMSANDMKRTTAVDNYTKASTIRTVAEQKKAYKELTKALESEHRARMAALKGDLNAQVSEHKRHNSAIEHLEKDHQAKMQALRSQSAMGRAANRFNMASMAGGGGLSGAITGVTAALGPMGMAVGAVLGGVVSLFSKATANAIEFERNTARIKTLLSDKQAETLPNALNLLAESSAKTGKPMAELQDSFYNVLSAAPALANNLAATAAITDKAAKTAMGLGAGTDEITLAAVKLSNALGLNIADIEVQDKMFNMLAATQNAGIMTGQEMASTIARTGPMMGFLTENAEHAMMAIGAMNAQLTAGGISAEESQAKINGLANELNNASTRTALMKAGLRGINEQGKVTDWVEVMKSGSENVTEIVSKLSSSEAKQAFLALSKEGGSVFEGMVSTMENAGGTYDRMFTQMSETTEGAQNRMSAAWDNMLTSIGTSSGSVFGKVFGFIADGLTFLRSLFEDSSKAVERTQAQLTEATALAADMQGTLIASNTALNEAMNAGSSDAQTQIVMEQFSLIKGKMDEITASAPIAAQEIQKILNDPSQQTVEGLAKINEQLAIADEFAKGSALSKSFEASDALAEQLQDKLDTMNAFRARDGDIIGGMMRDQVSAREELAEAEAAYSQAMQNFAANDVESQRQRADAQKRLVEAREDEKRITAEIGAANADARSVVDQLVEQQIKRAELAGEEINIDQLRLGVHQSLNEAGFFSEEAMARAVALTEESLNAAKDNLATRENEYELQVLQAEMAAQTAGVEEYVKDLLVEKGVAEASNNEQKIVGLEAASAALSVQISEMETLIQQGEASVLTDSAKLQVMNKLIEAQNELNKAQGSEVVAKQVSLEGLANQLKLAKAQVGALKEQKKQIDGQVDSLRKAAAAGGAKPGAAGGGRGGRGGKSEADREAEKAKREKEKAEKDAEKERIKRLQDEDKRRADEFKKRMAQAREEQKRQQELIEAMKRAREEVLKFGEQMKESRDKLIESNFQDLGGIVAQYIQTLQRAILDVTAIRDRQTKSVDELRKQIEQWQLLLRGEDAASAVGSTAIEAGQIGLQNKLLSIVKELSKLGVVVEGGERVEDNDIRDILAPLILSATTAQRQAAMERAAQMPMFSHLDPKTEEGQREFIRIAMAADQRRRSARAGAAMADQEGLGAEAAAIEAERQTRIEELFNEYVQANSQVAELLGKITQAEASLQITAEQIGPISELTANIKLLQFLVNTRKELADLEKEILSAGTLEQYIELQDKFNQKQADMNAQLAKFGVQETGVTDEIARLYDEVGKNLAKLTPEQLAYYQAVTPMLEDHAKLIRENAEIDHERLVETRLNLAKMLDQLQLQKDLGLFLGNEVDFADQKLQILNREINATRKLVALGLMEQSQLDEMLRTRVQIEDQRQQAIDTERQKFLDVRKQLDEFAASEREKVAPIASLRDKQKQEMDALSKMQFVTDEERIKATTDLQRKQNTELAEAYKKQISEVVMQALGIAEKIAGFVEEIGDISLKALKEEGRNFGQDFAKLMESVGQTTADMIGKATGLPIGEAFSAITSIGKAIVGFVSDMILLGDQNYRNLVRETNELARQNDLIQQRLDQLKAEQEFHDIQMGQFKARNDMAKEQLENDKKRLGDMLPVLRKLGAGVGISMGTGSFGGVSNALKSAQNMLLTFQAEYDSNNKRLEDDLSGVDRERREARKLWLEEQMQSLDMIVNGSKEYLETIANADELQRQMFQDRLDQVDHEQKMADLKAEIRKAQTGQSDEAFGAEKSQRDLKFLEQKKKITDDLLAKARKDYENELITRQELNAFEEQALELELQILQAKRDQNAENTIASDKIREMNMQRQALILKSRQDPLTADEIARVKGLEEKIIAEMLASGATPEAIEAAREGFRNSVPSFAEGTASLSRTGLILAHEGERIVPKMQNEAQTRALMGMQLDLKRLMMAQLMPNAGGIGDFHVEIGGVIVNVASGDAREIGRQVGVSVVSEFAKLHDEMHRKNPFGR